MCLSLIKMFTEIDDLKIYYEKTGDHGKDVILLHGWGQNTEMMAYIASFLGEHFTVYNLDFPGFGKSDTPHVSMSCEDYCEFLRHFIEKLEIDEKPIFIAHSFGCRIAIRYAYKYGAYKMCLTGAAGIRDKRTLKWYFKTYSYKLGKKIFKLLGKDISKYQNKVGSEDYRNASGIMRETFVKVVNDDISPLLKDIDTETLLVFGEKDEATPVEKGKMMEKLMKDATLVIFEGDDHYAYFHQADRFNRVLEAFLRSDYA